jgi:hypothetical protein
MIVLGILVLSSLSPVCAQWTFENSGSNASLRGIHSLGNGVAWASGTNGTVLRTTDGGATWLPCSIPPGAEKLDFRAIQGFSSSAAMAMSSGTGSQSRLYKTIDGCKTWQLIYTNPDPGGFWDAWRLGPDRGSGKDSTEGLLVGDPVHGHFPIWRVNINETNFQVTPLGDRPDSNKGEAAFAASNASLFVEWTYGIFWLGTGGKGGARVLRRDTRSLTHLPDAFTWYVYRSVKVPIAHGSDSSGIFALAFRPDPKVALKALSFSVGIAVGGDYQKPDESAGTAAFTTDGGKHWTASVTPPHGYRSAVAYDAAAQAWLTVGINGTDISTDDGRNWRAVKPNAALGEAADADRDWNAISLPFAVGAKGRIGKLDEAALKAALK